MDSVAPPLAAQRTVEVLENTRVARDTYRMRLDDPAMARAIRPGQFLMVRPSLGSDPLLGRPFALYDVHRDASGTPVAVDVVYVVLGRGTAALSEKARGERVSIWGPLGNGFGPAPDGPAVFVAGGIGQTPFLALAKWWTGRAAYGGELQVVTEKAAKMTMLYGVRSAELLAGLDDFRESGVEVEVATDDGSAGHHGLVTDLLSARIARREVPAKLIGCGPPPMLAAVARLADRHGIACDLSLENHMACGFGVCFSCVAPIRQSDGSTDLRRVCVEGPIFAAESVIFP